MNITVSPFRYPVQPGHRIEVGRVYGSESGTVVLCTHVRRATSRDVARFDGLVLRRGEGKLATYTANAGVLDTDYLCCAFTPFQGMVTLDCP